MVINLNCLVERCIQTWTIEDNQGWHWT